MSKANSESHSSTTSRRVHLDFPFKHKHATYLPSPFPAPVKSVPNPSALPAKQQLTPTIHIHSSIPNSLQLPLRCEDTCQDLEYFAKKGESQSSTKDKARFPIYGPTTSIPESERLLLDDPVHEGILNVYSQRRLGENAGLGIAGTLDRDIDISRIPDPAPTKDSKRPQVTWLRRTEYMSDKMKVFGQNRGAENDKRFVQNARKEREESKLFGSENSREEQIKAIEQKFDWVDNIENINRLKHPSNSALKVTEVYPFLPDFEMWTDEWTHTTYSDFPGLVPEAHAKANFTGETPLTLESVRLEEALLKPAASGNSQQPVLGFFLPSEKSAVILEKRRRRAIEGEEEEEEEAQDEEVVEYNHERDYGYEKISERKKNEKQQGAEKIVIRVVPDVGAFYMPISESLKLKRRRGKTELHSDRPTKYKINMRNLTTEEEERKKEKLATWSGDASFTI